MSRISIVIPCYNQAQYLGDCLRSIMAQTDARWEAIVVDDASTEGEPSQVVGSLSDSRVQLVKHEKNLGLSAARNTGIRISRGEFLLPLDADDKLAPEYAQRTVAFLDRHPECDCVFTDFQFFGESEYTCRYQLRDTRALLAEQWLPGSGTTFRKRLWVEVGGYCEAEELRIGNEDWDFYLAAAAAGFKAGHIPEALYYYRRHRESMVKRLARFDYQTRVFMYHRHRELFDRYGLGGSFVAAGYRKSIAASLRRRELRRAASLLAQATRLPPARGYHVAGSLARQLLTVTISPVAPGIRRLWRKSRQMCRAATAVRG